MALVQAMFEACWPCWQRHFSSHLRLRLGGVPLAAVSGCAPDTASRALGPDELAQWRGLGLEKRRLEWLGGRLAAKWSAAGLLGETSTALSALEIRTEADGRPSVATAAHPVAPFISISHSGLLAVALAATLPCGLDIQEPVERILRVRARFAAPEEEDILAASLPGFFSETERLAMLWAAKEAVRKMVRITPLLGLLEIRLLGGRGGCGAQNDPLALYFASGRDQEECPAVIPALCFFADNLAWAMACPAATEE